MEIMTIHILDDGEKISMDVDFHQKDDEKMEYLTGTQRAIITKLLPDVAKSILRTTVRSDDISSMK